MELNLALDMAKRELKKQGLGHWQVRFNDRRCSFGVCSYREETIYLSRYLVALNSPERVMNTILHEIAHAILGPGHGHDDEWKKTARALGSDGIRCYTSSNTVTPKLEKKYTYICTTCGVEIHMTYRMQVPRACRNCCNEHNYGAYDRRFNLVLKGQSNG